MNNWESCKEYLTEKVLGECWHSPDRQHAVGVFLASGTVVIQKCTNCGRVLSNSYGSILDRRTFDSIQDLHDLYSVSKRAGKWGELKWYLNNKLFETIRRDDNLYHFCENFLDWIFCLNGTPDDFKARCQMVAEWHGWKGDENVGGEKRD